MTKLSMRERGGGGEEEKRVKSSFMNNVHNLYINSSWRVLQRNDRGCTLRVLEKREANVVLARISKRMPLERHSIS